MASSSGSSKSGNVVWPSLNMSGARGQSGATRRMALSLIPPISPAASKAAWGRPRTTAITFALPCIAPLTVASQERRLPRNCRVTSKPAPSGRAISSRPSNTRSSGFESVESQETGLSGREVPLRLAELTYEATMSGMVARTSNPCSGITKTLKWSLNATSRENIFAELDFPQPGPPETMRKASTRSDFFSQPVSVSESQRMCTVNRCSDLSS